MKKSLLEQFVIMPLFWIALVFLGGIFAGSALRLPVGAWVVLAVLAFAAAFLVRRLRGQALLLILLLPGFFLLGATWYEAVQPDNGPDFIGFYNDSPVSVYVTGTLAEAPDVRDSYENLRLKVDAVDAGSGDVPANGLLLVKLGNIYPVSYGQRLRVRGLVKTPPQDEDFSYRDYLALQGIRSMLSTNAVTVIPIGGEKNPVMAFFYAVNASLLKRLYGLFPEPEASLLAGILLGQDNNISADLQQAFKNTGTAHIIAISGFNISIVAAIFVVLFSRYFGRRNGAILAILGIIFYTLVVGAGPSVVRAALMGTLSIIAAQFGRRNMALNTLAFTAMLMAMFNPLVVWDISFQISFMATLGLILYAQPMEDAVTGFIARRFPKAPVEKIASPISEYILLTVAAQITTLPIMAYYFQRISLVALIANPFILPAQPPLMVLSGLAVVLGRLYLPLGQVVAWLAWPFLAYTIRMVEFFNGFPGGVLPLDNFSLLFVIAFYVVLFTLTLTGPRLSRYRAVLRPTAGISVLMIFVVLTWRSVLNVPDGRLHVTFLDAGSSDAILITTPSGARVLVNGGASASQLSDQLGRRVPPFERRLDYAVIASTQEDEVAALPRTLAQFRPAKVLWMGDQQASFSAQQLAEWFSGQNIPVHNGETGDVLDLGQGARLRVLAASPSGGILSVEWNNFRVILPVGVNFDMLDALANGQGIGPVNGLLLAQSGYAPANPQAWIQNLSPQVIVLSVAAGDPNGLPSPDLLAGLKGDNLLRTDVNGWIDLASDGRNTWTTVERK